MATMEDTTNILGYYDESWYSERDVDQPLTSMKLAEILAMGVEPLKRWPVNNREPRTPISSQKRAIIHSRDGGYCQYCHAKDQRLVLDHIVPRSTFHASELLIADRSDNLQSACWDCNEKRSNYEIHPRKKMGVVVACWYCLNPEYEAEDCQLERPCELDVLVYCGRCGISAVPDVRGWVL